MTLPRFSLLRNTDSQALSAFFCKNNHQRIRRQFNPFPLDADSATRLLDKASKDLIFGLWIQGSLAAVSMLRGFDEGYTVPSFGIIVDAQSQNQGIGSQLTRWTLQWADEHDFETVRLSVFSDNPAAYALYQKNGFIETSSTGDKKNRQKLVMHRSRRHPSTEVYASLQALKPCEPLDERIETWTRHGLNRIECTYYPVQHDAHSIIEELSRENSKFTIHNYFPPDDPEFVFNLASPNPQIAEKSISYVETTIERSSRLKSPWLSLHAGFIHDPHGRDAYGFTFPDASQSEQKAALERFSSRFASLAQSAKRKRIRLLVENNVCTQHNKGKLLLCTPDEIAHFLDLTQNDNIGILLDTGHLSVSAKTFGFKIEEKEKIREGIVGMHLHSNDGTADTHEPATLDSWAAKFAKNIKPAFISLEGRYDSIETLQNAYQKYNEFLNG